MWLVSFNSSKTKAMNISLKRNHIDQSLSFQSEQLSTVQNHKHLGLILNDKLSWNSHIQSITNNALKHVNIMKRQKWKLD